MIKMFTDLLLVPAIIYQGYMWGAGKGDGLIFGGLICSAIALLFNAINTKM